MLTFLIFFSSIGLIIIGMLGLEKEAGLLLGEQGTVHSALIALGLCAFLVMGVLFNSGVITNGSPLNKIGNGSYAIVSSAKVTLGKEECFCFVLRKGGRDNLYFYLLPEDRIKTVNVCGTGYPNSLEVTTKWGIKKVVLSVFPPPSR